MATIQFVTSYVNSSFPTFLTLYIIFSQPIKCLRLPVYDILGNWETLNWLGTFKNGKTLGIQINNKFRNKLDSDHSINYTF